ncbi:HNH endonuclease [Algihabitans sp.]|uniref:HNH endonuclease n=1 Tax=Algihabitans sp. TaxID=2821514 RepID=UPI003BA84A1E
MVKFGFGTIMVLPMKLGLIWQLGRRKCGWGEADQIQAIQAGRSNIPRLTWHHHQDSWRMQLVPRSIHRETGHIGGESMSGRR